jgi:hypothetical protein
MIGNFCKDHSGIKGSYNRPDRMMETISQTPKMVAML